MLLPPPAVRAAEAESGKQSASRRYQCCGIHCARDKKTETGRERMREYESRSGHPPKKGQAIHRQEPRGQHTVDPLYSILYGTSLPSFSTTFPTSPGFRGPDAAAPTDS